MIAQILSPDEITKEEREYLWNQDINMDDWDYMILAPKETITLIKDEENTYDQNEYLLHRLLTGCCNNVWYKCFFRGKEYAIGIAYHS